MNEIEIDGMVIENGDVIQQQGAHNTTALVKMGLACANCDELIRVDERTTSNGDGTVLCRKCPSVEATA